MRKFILILLLALTCFLLVNCKANSSSTKVLDSNSKSKEEFLKESVSKYYLSKEPNNKGEIKIYDTKSFKDKYLVLVEKYSGDGHRLTNLFLADKNYNIIAWTSGETPISMCFSINKVDYDDTTILFGTFNNSKWDSKQDKKTDVQINHIAATFANKNSVKEEVTAKNGYIVVSDSVSKVEQFNLYNEKNELQSSLKELGDINGETQFRQYKLE